MLISDPLVIYLVIGALTVVLFGLLMRLAGQPLITGYLLAGLALGPHGLNVISDRDLVGTLGAMGVVILLFFIGAEVSPRALAQRWRVALIGTSLQAVASVAVVALLGLAFDWPWARIVLIGFVISLSCTAIAVDHLKSRGLFNTPIGQDSLMILIAQDIFVIPMLIILGLFAGQDTDLQTLGLQLSGGLLIIAVLSKMLRQQAFELPIINRLAAGDAELQVFLALALCFGLALFTASLQLSTALGAFVGGLIVGQARNVSWVLPRLQAARVIFVALFFASVGMLIDIGFVAARWREILGLVALIFVVNTAVNAVILKLLGRHWRESVFAGALLAHVGEFSFVLAAIGYNSGIILEAGYQITISVIAISLALGSLWIQLLSFLQPATSPEKTS